MLGPDSPRSRPFWLLQIGGWLTLIPVFVGLNLLADFPPELVLLNGVARQFVGFLLTLVLWRIYRRWSPTEGSIVRQGAVAAGLSLAATAADVAIFDVLQTKFHFISGTGQPFLIVFGAALGRLLLYAGWSALYLTLRQFFHSRDRNLQLAHAEIAVRDAELQMLRAQLDPHFLFNALNSIIAEADDNPAGVKTITRGLSDFLRFSLRQRDHFGQLGEELAAIENYLCVERSRYEERLDWHIDVPPALRSARVPCALVLPLVENAIKYGLQTTPAGLELRVSAEQHGDSLTASVENSGHWVEPNTSGINSTRIGLANLRRRLGLLCGERASVDISFPPGAVRVEVTVPLEQSPS